MRLLALLALTWLASTACWSQDALVLQSDFGTKDGAVAAMKGVAIGVSPKLVIHDLTHEIPAYSIWEGALRLAQTAEYWPAGTVFVCVVDPGVGTERKSVVLRTKSGHYFVTPDNGTLTFVAKQLGIDAVREIDEAVNRRKNSEKSYTFHGRDVYAYTGARLAAGVITFEQVGRALPAQVVTIQYQQPHYENGIIDGNIPILDVQYGNIWTNIDRQMFSKLKVAVGESVKVRISNDSKVVAELSVPYYETFGGVDVGEPLLYLNSLDNVALAVNQGSFAEMHGVSSGPQWSIRITKN